MPPALRLPVRVVDLTAVEHGNKIAIRFTIPTVTTEALAIREPLNIELRVGPAGANGFNLEEWIRTSDRVIRIPQSNPVADVSVDDSRGRHAGAGSERQERRLVEHAGSDGGAAAAAADGP